MENYCLDCSVIGIRNQWFENQKEIIEYISKLDISKRKYLSGGRIKKYNKYGELVKMYIVSTVKKIKLIKI